MHYNFDEIIPRASTNSVKYDLRKKIFGKEDVIPMWVADMDFATPDFIVDAVRERAKHPVFGYSFRSDDYFRSIINWQKRNHNWVIEKEWVRFSAGIVPALNFCVMAYTDPGDKIIVQPPVYFPFFSAIRNHGRVQVNNPLKLDKGRLNMDFDNLRKKAAEGAKMLFLCSPHNPGGSVWTQKELAEMVNICLDYNILIVSDEIHCDLLLPGYNHKPTATLSEAAADITITCIAPSKTFNLAGMATSSVIISNKTLQEKFDTLMEQLHVGMGNLFGAVASEAAYAKGERWLEELIAYIDGNVRFALDFFEKNIPGIKAIRPEATYMLWLDCRKMEMDDEQLCKFFVEEAGVGMNKGESFGEGGEGFMRMNLACPRKTIKRALGRIKYAIDCHMNTARKK